MNCENCLNKCKAACCGAVPIPKATYLKHKPVRVADYLDGMGDTVIAIDRDGYCVFLGKDFKCSIYEDRPEVCRKFGDESHPLMTCKWQGKDGRIRERSERRRLERDMEKRMSYVLNQLK